MSASPVAMRPQRLPEDLRHNVLRVLLIEDSPTDALALSEHLCDIPEIVPKVVHVATLSDALVKLRNNDFDIVFTDLNLPDSHGIETFKWLQSVAKQQPIIVLTSEQRPEVVHELFQLGAQDCLVKREYVGWMLWRSILLATERFRVAVELASKNEELRRSEQRIREIIEASSAAFLVVDEKGIVQYVNQSASTMLRRSADRFVGTSCGFSTDPGMIAEINIYRADGSSGVADLQVVNAVWDGKPARLVSLHDITLRKMAEEELASTNVRLRSALEGGGGIGTWVFHVGRGQIAWDGAVAKLLSTAGGAHLHKGIKVRALLSLIHEDDRARAAAALANATQHSGDIDIEFRTHLLDGSVRWFAAKGHAESMLDGKPVRITGACMDITQRKLSEDAHMRGQKLEALGTLAGGIAHDFNNILLAINSSASLALQDANSPTADTDTLRKRIGIIQQAGSRAAALVRQILTFSRVTELTHDPIDIAPILHEAYAMLRSTLPSTISLKLNVPDNLSSVDIDPTQLHQIIVNLATNASHAIGITTRGEVIVDAQVVYISSPANLTRTHATTPHTTAELQPGKYVCISVSDTGCGMAQSTLEKIFDPFFTTKPVGQGTGLGLSVVHGIVRACGGAIDVSSVLNEGTRFDVYFPASTRQVSVDLQPKPREIPHGDGQRILYIDDDEILASLGQEVLLGLGYEVHSFTDPVRAVAVFQANPSGFEAVITDLSMPGMSGLEVGRALLAIRPEIPIVVMSGYVRADDLQVANELGIREVVLKPRSLVEIGIILHRLVGAGE